MESRSQFLLQNSNSFRVKSVCPTIYFPKTLSDLKFLPDLTSVPFYILGDGSNTLFVEDKAPIIIRPDFKGVRISETSDSYIVRVGAGENWHELVKYCQKNEIYGLENLALIPGSVGAAPVQNIGAYGVELANFCNQVKWFEFSTQTIKSLRNVDCQFSYRNSIFKEELYNKGIITEVEFLFPKKWQANLSYSGLNELGEGVTADQIMNKVISMRQAKLPDHKILPNAGSFFKNPIVSKPKANKLQGLYPSIPLYPQKDGQVKIAAGWLIEHADLKGFRKNGVGVHINQALVLVNYESDNGKDVIDLAKYVQHKVSEMFDIIISPEVRLVMGLGERGFNEFHITDGY